MSLIKELSKISESDSVMSQRGPSPSETDVMEAAAVFGEIAENLIHINSELDYAFEKQLGKLESKHEVYLGENLRELKFLIKLAIATSKKLYESLEDLPTVSESVKQGPTFRVAWKGYGKTVPKVVGLDFFSEDNSFDEEDLKEIKQLAVGEEWTFGGPMGKVTVTRIK